MLAHHTCDVLRRRRSSPVKDSPSPNCRLEPPYSRTPLGAAGLAPSSQTGAPSVSPPFETFRAPLPVNIRGIFPQHTVTDRAFFTPVRDIGTRGCPFSPRAPKADAQRLYRRGAPLPAPSGQDALSPARRQAASQPGYAAPPDSSAYRGRDAAVRSKCRLRGPHFRRDNAEAPGTAVHDRPC